MQGGKYGIARLQNFAAAKSNAPAPPFGVRKMADRISDAAGARTAVPGPRALSQMLRKGAAWARAALLPRWLLALGRAAACRWRRNRALGELASIDPRILKDIGLRPGDIWTVAQAYACGAPGSARELLRSAGADCRCASMGRKAAIGP